MFMACDHCSSTEPAHCCSALSVLVSYTVLYCRLMLMSYSVFANQKYLLFVTVYYYKLSLQIYAICKNVFFYNVMNAMFMRWILHL